MCMWNSRGRSTAHCFPQGPRTSLAFTCIKIECPTQAPDFFLGGGGAGVSNDWCINFISHSAIVWNRI